MLMVLGLGLFVPTALQASEITVTIDGIAVNFEGQGPTIVDGRTLVPVRGVFEALGFDVDWYQPTQTATLTGNDHVVVISIDSPTFTTNGASHPLDVPAQIIEGRTMLPIRAVLQAVGKDVDWDDTTQTVVITYDPNTDTLFVRDDGARFEFLGGDMLWITFDSHGTAIWLDDYFMVFDIDRANDDLQRHGFRAIDYATLRWVLGGPHPVDSPFLGRGARIEQVPIWYYYVHYRNQFARPAMTNGHFATTFESFVDTQARPNATGSLSQFWAGRGITGLEFTPWPPVNPQLDQGARFAFQSGFAGDEIRHVFPFSPAFFNRMTNEIENHFWVRHDGDPYQGLGGYRQIGISIAPEQWFDSWYYYDEEVWYDYWDWDWSYNAANSYRGAQGASQWDRGHAHTAAHELAHAFGLAEHLSHFFDEVMIGWTPQEGWISSSGGGGLYRTSAMDRVLLQLAGPVAFWEAVFWSEERYARLWNQHLGHVVSYETMQLARGGHEVGIHQGHRQQSFINAMGHGDHWQLTYDISRAFLNAFDTNLSQSQRDNYRNQAQFEINRVANWARQLNIQPYEAIWVGHIPTRVIVTPLN